MSVVGADTRLVFCEGKPESLDAALLHELVRSSSVHIVASGGKYGLRAFIEGRLSVGAAMATHPDYFALRDRDFDAEPPPKPRLIPLPGEKPIFMTYRACVESYLLDPELIDAYWLEKSAAPRWKHGQSPGSSQVARWIEEAAKEIACYQAVRWALASVKPGERWPQIHTRWTKGSGHLPSSLSLDDCLAEAKKLVAEFEQATANVTVAKLESCAQTHSNRFEQEEFWTEQLYLVWFHGKDLMKSLQKRSGMAISMKHYCEWAVKHVKWEEHADLCDVAAKLA